MPDAASTSPQRGGELLYRRWTMSRDSAKEPGSDLRAWMLLLLILAGLGLAKLSYDIGTGPYGLDASFYFQLAQNVSQGEGVVTNVSLDHEGLATFPQRMMIYPLWPLVLGYAGRVLGMFTAAKLLPPIFYILDLLLLYVLANRLSTRLAGHSDLVDVGVIQLKVGHLFVLLLGLNTIFFAATSHPYTEGLAFLLAFGALLLLDYSAERRAVAFVGLCAVACGLAFLARSQMIVLGVGIGAALIINSLFERRYRLPSLVFLGVFSFFGLWWWYRFIHTLPLDRASIPAFQMWVEPVGWSGYLKERLQGVAVSFSLANPDSYVKLFGPAIFPRRSLVFLLSGDCGKRPSCGLLRNQSQSWLRGFPERPRTSRSTCTMRLSSIRGCSHGGMVCHISSFFWSLFRTCCSGRPNLFDGQSSYCWRFRSSAVHSKPLS